MPCTKPNDLRFEKSSVSNKHTCVLCKINKSYDKCFQSIGTRFHHMALYRDNTYNYGIELSLNTWIYIQAIGKSI